MKSRNALFAQASAVIAARGAAWNIRKHAMFGFEKVLLATVESGDSDDAGVLADLAPLLPTLNRLYESFETQLESEFVHELLSGKTLLENYELFARFQRLVAAEIALAGIGAAEEIIMIGSGPLPITAILLSQAGLSVTAVERNPDSAALSRRLINQLGLRERITVCEADGQTAIFPKASCVLIAVLAAPKRAILSNILGNYASCRKVICRTSEGVRQALYVPVDKSSLHGYELVSVNTARRDQTISSILLAKPQT